MVTKRSIYLGLFFCFLLFSCKKDDNEIDDTPEGGIINYPVNQSVGYSAKDLLSDEDFKNVVIEINCFNVFPQDQTLNEIKSFLGDRLHKTSISVVIDTNASSGLTSVNTGNLVSFDESSRDYYTTHNSIVVNCNYFDANYTDENVLGVAFYNTSIALFGEKIKSISNDPLEPPRWQVESTVFLHELGHILGLVNTGSSMINNHQDEAHGKHCDNENCLMYWSVETSDVVNNLLSTNTIPDLDNNCILDLQNNGGK